jgi:hypothetical protein
MSKLLVVISCLLLLTTPTPTQASPGLQPVSLATLATVATQATLGATFMKAPVPGGTCTCCGDTCSGENYTRERAHTM